MIENSQKQSGSILIVLVVILAAAIVGALGYVAWNQLSNTANLGQQNSDEGEPQKPLSEVIVLENSDMNKYVNYESSFEFLFPKQTYTVSECQASTTKFDRFGNTVPSEPHYVGKDGPVPMVVLEKEGEYIIVASKTVVQSAPQENDAGSHIYTACDVFPTTLGLVEESRGDNSDLRNVFLEHRSFIVKDASDERAATDVSKDIFRDSGGTVSWTQDPDEPSRKVGEFRYDPTIERTGGFAYKLWYYPGQDKVVFFAIGHSVYFQHPDGTDEFYEVVSSFKFIAN